MFKLQAACQPARRWRVAFKSLERQIYTFRARSRAISITRFQRNVLQSGCTTNLRSHLNIYPSYSTLPQEENKAQDPQTDDERSLALLERISEQILASTPPNDESDRLRISYSLIYEITRYLARHGDDSAAYLSVFMNSEAPPGSDIARARKCVFQLTEYVVRALSTIPSTSSHRTAHSAIFDLVGALEPSFMTYDGESGTREWTTFWSRVQPITLELALQLDQAGFGG
ncbi:hypothetical protein C8R45DRAFT_407918 [Mycena sanguinolenta]|nr:hypothetical protein C8R45DRAFT_407918 [Mycena sanguinolenta]